MAIFPDPKWSEQRMNNFWWVFWFAATWDFCLQKNIPKDGETWDRGGWFQMGYRWVLHKEAPTKKEPFVGGVRSTPRWATSRSLYMEL